MSRKQLSPIIIDVMMRHDVPNKGQGEVTLSIQQGKGKELWLLYKGIDLYKPNRPLSS